MAVSGHDRLSGRSHSFSTCAHDSLQDAVAAGESGSPSAFFNVDGERLEAMHNRLRLVHEEPLQVLRSLRSQSRLSEVAIAG